MNINTRLIFSGIAFIISLLFIGFNGSWEYGFGVGLVVALTILFVTSDSFKAMQKRDAERRRRREEVLAEEETIRHEEAQREIGRLQGKADYNRGKAEAIRTERRRTQIQKRQKELYERTKRYYDNLGGVI